MYSLLLLISKWSCRSKRIEGKEKKERKEKGGGQVVKTKEYYPPLSLVQTKERPRALVCLYNISKKRLYSEREKDGGRGRARWVFLAKKQNERRRGSERKKKGTGDPFRFYTTVNSNCTRWLMAFPFSLLFAKIPSYTSLISHSHANEDRSCNDILRWETPARDGLGWWWWLGVGG